MLIYINYKLLIKMLNYLLLSICHIVGKISTMYYNVVKLVLCNTIYVIIRTMHNQLRINTYYAMTSRHPHIQQHIILKRPSY